MKYSLGLGKTLSKETKNKIARIYLIGTGIALIITLIFLFVTLQAGEQFKPVAIFNFKESDFMQVNQAKLYTDHRIGIVLPNDQLRLFLNVTNKNPSSIVIKPYLETYIGGKLVDQEEKDGILLNLEETNRMI